ncbi:protein ABIL1-like [Malania oleifera]|uniref:protein ABIL1-like n=1 Tax=Malania oleifera TaxID=397392 RepID=UPI0025AEA6ED|nr:protein ABIL1-like [Malania oleifera]
MIPSKSFSYHNLNEEAQSQDALSFYKSLQELKDLRSQLHYAADYSETKFLGAEEKNNVIEDTKLYVTKAVVAVVDHLGAISSHLDSQLSKNNSFFDTELQINCLDQKLVTWQKYAHKLALASVSWNTPSPRHYPHYIFTYKERGPKPSKKFEGCKPITAKTMTKQELHTKEMPVLLCSRSDLRSSLERNLGTAATTNWDTSNSASVMSVHGGKATPKPNPSLRSQSTLKQGRKSFLHRKSFQKTEILSILGWNKTNSLNIV